MARTVWFIAGQGMTPKGITCATVMEVLIAYQGGEGKIAPKVR